MRAPVSVLPRVIAPPALTDANVAAPLISAIEMPPPPSAERVTGPLAANVPVREIEPAEDGVVLIFTAPEELNAEEPVVRLPLDVMVAPPVPAEIVPRLVSWLL